MRLLLPARTYIALVLLASLIGLPIQGAAMAASMSPSAIADMSSSDNCDGCGDDFSVDNQCPDVICSGFHGVVANSAVAYFSPHRVHTVGRHYGHVGQHLFPEPAPPRV